MTGKVEKKSKRKPKSSPASVVIIGAGAAGGAAAEMLRREGYDEPVTWSAQMNSCLMIARIFRKIISRVMRRKNGFHYARPIFIANRKSMC